MTTREELRRDRQVERVVAAGAADPVEVVDRAARAGRTRRRRRSRPARTGCPRRAGARPSSRNGVRACCWTASWTTWPKSWSAQSRRANPTSAKPGGSSPRLAQVVDRGHELLAGEVAGDAEDHQPARPGDPVAAAGRAASRSGLCPCAIARRASCVLLRPVARPSAASELRRGPAARSVRCRRSTGRPWSASTCASPAAWAAMSWPKVNGRSGIARSSPAAPVICRKTPDRRARPCGTGRSSAGSAGPSRR